jgi:hypothetical protein
LAGEHLGLARKVDGPSTLALIVKQLWGRMASRMASCGRLAIDWQSAFRESPRLLALGDQAPGKEPATRSPALPGTANLQALCKFLLRLGVDLKLLAGDSQEFAAGRLEEIGRMIGGWRKAA